MPETVLVLDFGSQYTQLIARRVREADVYCRILPCDAPIERIRELSPRAVILSGGPASVWAGGSPRCAPEVLTIGVPILGRIPESAYRRLVGALLMALGLGLLLLGRRA